MFEIGDKVKIKSPPEMLLPPSGRIKCDVSAMKDVYVVWLDMSYYGLNYLLINAKWLTKAEK